MCHCKCWLTANAAQPGCLVLPELRQQGFNWGFAEFRELEWTSDEGEAAVVERLVQRKTAHSMANLEVLCVRNASHLPRLQPARL
jgi:hypothetical protein